MITIHYGVILEKDDRDAALTKILRALPPSEQRFLYENIYADEYALWPAEGKIMLENRDINDPNFVHHAITNLNRRDGLWTYITEKYPLLRVKSFTELAAIYAEDTLSDVPPYTYMDDIDYDSVSNEGTYQLESVMEDFGLDLTPKWFIS